MNGKTKKPKPPTAAQYERAANAEARNFAPPIIPCMKCRWPVVKGYCCMYCGDSDPSSKEEL